MTANWIQFVKRSIFKKQILFLICFIATYSFTSFSQVSLQTGTANFSIPMFNWKDEKSRLFSNVGLTYSSGNGLKVNEVASNVGQGWSLLSGGVITRMQVGEPDDQMPYGTVSDFDTNKYPPGYLYATVPAANGCPIALTTYPVYRSMNQVYSKHNKVAEDRELDFFSFQFNGKAGIFVLDPTNGDKGVTLGDSKLKITFQRNPSLANGSSSGIRTSITSFTIQDVDGLIYKFTKHSLTKVLRTEYCDASLNYLQTQPKFKNDRVYYQAGFDHVTKNPWIINGWYLTEIEDALTHRKVFFNYTTRYLDVRAGEDVSYNQADKQYIIISHRRSITQTPEISSIVYPDGHNLTFNYAAQQRHDLAGMYPLSFVDISYQGRYLSRYKLKTTYFILNRYGTPTDDQKRISRLCLQSVQKIGVDLKEETLPYIFDYYKGSNNTDDFVPPPFFYAKDIWGFYNGNNTVSYEQGAALPVKERVKDLSFDQLKGLCFIRKVNGQMTYNYYTAKSGLAKNGLLRQIIYPTGGTLTYEYEQNTGVVEGATRQAAGVHVSKTISTDGGFSNNCSNPLSTSYNYISNGASSLWGLEKPATALSFSNHYQPDGKYYYWNINTFPFGACGWRYQFPGILAQQQSVDLPQWIHTMNTLSPVFAILNIISTIKDIVTVISGGSPVGLVITVVLGILQTAISCIGDHSKDKTNAVYYSFDLNSGNPLPAQFKRVEIVENPGTIGKTVQEFTSSEDYAIWEPINLNFSSRQRFAPWAYGLPKKTITLDAQGNLVKEVRNVYNFNTTFPAKCPSIDRYNRANLLKKPLNRISAKCFATHQTSLNSADWNNPAIYAAASSYKTSSQGGLNVDIYDLYSGRAELDTTYDKVYSSSSSSQFVETVTGYVYNDDNYEVGLIRTISSDGKVTQKNIYYTIDYIKTYGNCYILSNMSTSNSQINTLVQNNIISLPVETNEQVEYNYSLAYTYDKATLFTTLSNGDIKPAQVLEGRFTVPADRTSPWPTEETSFSYRRPGPLLDPANPDYSFYKVAQTFSYDNSGNLVNVNDDGGRNVSNIYGYNDKFVTATAINAKANEIFFASFEENNGWSGTTAPQYGDVPISAFDNTMSRTGKMSARIDNGTAGERYSHSNQSLNISLSAPTKYKVSGWVYSNGPSADIYLFMKRANETFYYSYVDYLTVNAASQWLYVEKEFTVPVDVTQLNLRLDNNGGGTVWFDDIRLYPAHAQMTTLTYDPLLGKTSESDVNNRAVHYDYDNLGRLQFIKDDKKNVVKMYEYNNVSAGKQNGCPGIYYNSLITETYRKNNCGAGYLGSEVAVNVAANTYSSSISQYDADAKAELYLLTNGQNLANSSPSATCSLIYYNDAKSQTFTTQNCPEGYIGGNVTYTVPTGRYSSLVSKAEANEMAQDELDANGQAFANNPANVICNVDYNPYWVADEGAATQCQWSNGQAYIFKKAMDVNPNSNSYGQMGWQNTGEPGDCPPPYGLDVTLENNTNCGHYIYLTNTDTYEQYYFYVDAWTWNLLGNVPEGTYNIEIVASCNSYAPYLYYSADCSNYTSGYGYAYFSNVYLSTYCAAIYIHY